MGTLSASPAAEATDSLYFIPISVSDSSSDRRALVYRPRTSGFEVRVVHGGHTLGTQSADVVNMRLPSSAAGPLSNI